MKKRIVRAVTLLAVVVATSAPAQIVLTGTNYSQSFDDLASGLPPGWSVQTNSTANALGTDAAFTTNCTSWGTTGAQFANYASTMNNGTNLLGTESAPVQAAFANRCLGMRQSSSFGDPGAAFVVRIANTLGFARFRLAIDLNMLSVQSRSNLWTIDYGIGANPTSFTPVWTNSDPGVFGATTVILALGRDLDDQPEPVWIRVVALSATAGGGSRDTFGIDDLVLSYGPSGTASSPLHIELSGTNVVLTWANPSFALQAAPQVGGVFTSVPGAVSPYTNPVADTRRYFRLKAN